MVAGRESRSQNEQQSGEHQPGRGGELGVVPDLQDRRGSREARRQLADVEPGRTVDEEDDGEADEAEGEYDPAEPVAPGEGGEQADRDRDRTDRDEQVGVCGAGGFDALERRRGAGQARVAGLSDLDPAVVDELRGDEKAPGGEDHAADRPFRGEKGAGAGRGPDR
jgi:hypothetical protein